MADKDNEIPIVLTVDSSALSDLESLASDVPSEISIDVTADTSNADVSDITDLDGETITPEIDTTESEDGKKVREGIGFLATMKKIEIAINVIGTAIDFVKDIGNLTVAPFLEVDDAVAKINAQTGSGTGIADLGQFIRDIQAADLGTGVQQISDVVIAAQQLGAPVEEATKAALTFTHTFADQSPVESMKTMKSLADEFGISMQDAADLMTVFFQNGGNKAGDALATVDKYSQSWKDMGLTIPQALSSVQSLMAGGVDSADAAAKMVQNFDDAATKAAADPNSAEAKMLNMMGITNPKDSGQAIGAKTIDGFVSAFNNLPADQQDLASGLFFGKTGKLDTSAIGGLTTQSDMFANVTGAAAAAAQEVDNSFTGAVNDFVLAVNTSMQTLLSSKAIDLPGKIKALKDGFQEGVNVLTKGGSLGDALEVALKIPGLSDSLDTFIGNFERIIGNLQITFLQVVAMFQDITRQPEAAAATREQIKGLSTTQLSFDLKLANSDEVPAMINQALSRGLDVKTIEDSVHTALSETLASGDFGQHINILDGLIKNNLKNGVDSSGTMSAEFVQQLQDQANNALAAGNINLLDKMIAIPSGQTLPGLDDAVAGIKKQVSDAFIPQNRGMAAGVSPFDPANMSAMFPGVGGKAGATSANGGMFAGVIAAFDDATGKADTATEAIGTSLNHITDTTATVAATATTDMGTVSTAFNTAAVDADLMDQGINLSFVGHSVVDTFAAVASAAGQEFPIVLSWFGQTAAGAAEMDAVASGHIQHMLNQLHDLQFLSAQVAQGVKDALQAGANLPASGTGSGSNTTVNNNVNQTNNNQNNAQTQVNGFQIAAAINGGG